MHPPSAGSPADLASASDSDLPAGVSVIVPCYNSEAILGDLVGRLARELPGCGERHEAILVDDGSADRTWDVIARLTAEYPWVRGVRLMRNYGQDNATLCGARLARYDVSVTMDDDLQHPPAEIPKLLAKLREGHDVVFGTPHKASHPFYRNVASWIARLSIAVATRQRGVRELSSFRAYRTVLRRAFVDFRSPQLFFDVLLGWGTLNLAAVAVHHDPRRVGGSNYGLFRLLNAMLRLWIGYTTAPLRLTSWLGFGLFAFGVGILVYVLVIYLTQGSLPGFPFLASTIALFGGAQLFALGIIGEYLARMYARSMDWPVYVVKQTASAPEVVSSEDAG